MIKECQYVVCRRVCEEILKDVVCTEWRTIAETRFKKVCRVEKHPITCYKTVAHKQLEWVTEKYCVPGKKIVTWKRDPASFCFDPCTMKGACDPGRLVRCEMQCPDEIRCRKYPRWTTCCEVVPVTRYEKHVIEEEVPYTVCRKVKVQVCKQVPVKVSRLEQQVCTRQVPVTVRRMVPETFTRQVVINKSRKARGAYVDGSGIAHACPAPGREFVEGACWQKTLTCVNHRMVPETVTRQVPCTTYNEVQEKRTKQVPYTVCRMEQKPRTRIGCCKVTEMVEETKVRRIPYTVCNMVPCTVTRVVKEKVCEMVPHTVKVQVPVTYCEQIACTVTKKVPVCVEKEVCVRKVRLEPVCQDPCLKGFINRVQPVDPGYKGRQAPPNAQSPVTGLTFHQTP